MDEQEQISPAIPAWRAPRFNALGTLDIEIEVGGRWLPFTAASDDVEAHGRDLYAAVLAAGGIDPYLPPSIDEARSLLPDLSRKQFRLGMRALGVTSAMIDAAIAAIEDEDAREIAQIEWEDSASYARLHPLIPQLSEAFGKTAEQIDAVWAEAANLV